MRAAAWSSHSGNGPVSSVRRKFKCSVPRTAPERFARTGNLLDFRGLAWYINGMNHEAGQNRQGGFVMKKKYLLIPVVVIAVTGLLLAAAGAGENDFGTVFTSARAAEAAVGNDDLQIEVLQTRFCRDTHRHGNRHGVQEIVGRVVSTGKNVSGLRVGDRVGFCGWTAPCGECADCLAGRPEACRYSGRVCEVGCDRHPEGCRNRVVVSRHCVVALPDRETGDLFPRLCGKMTDCPRLYCHDSIRGDTRNRSYGHGHCGESRHGGHCR